MIEHNPTLADKALMTRAMWRIMPLIILCSIVGTVDRTNIGYAKLGMLSDLGMTEATFALGSSLFFIGYILFVIPSTVASARYGGRIWFSCIMIAWSLVTLALSVTPSSSTFYVLRFVLGAAEAGIYPAQLYFLTLWFPQSERVRAIGLLTLGNALGNGLSALLCGALLGLEGTFEIRGWQWIFLITSIAPLLITYLTLKYLPNKPSDASFFNDAEKARVAALLAADPPPVQRTHGISAIFNWNVVMFGLLYGLILGSLYGVIYWAPTVFNGFHVSGAKNGFIVAMPWAVDVLLLALIPTRIRRHRSVLIALILFSILAAVSFAVGALDHRFGPQVAALLAGIPAMSLVLGFFWTLTVRRFHGPGSAGAIGAVSTIGNIGGVGALNAMPALASLGGSASTALWCPCLGMIIILLYALFELRAAKISNPAG
jgi:MFS family permease